MKSRSRRCASTLSWKRKQVGRLQAVRARRDGAAVERVAGGAQREAAAQEGRNLMDPLLECARALASEGEIIESLQQVFGDYSETPVFWSAVPRVAPAPGGRGSRCPSTSANGPRAVPHCAGRLLDRRARAVQASVGPLARVPPVVEDCRGRRR